MMFVRLFLLAVCFSICGCFSAPSEPDWAELSAGFGAVDSEGAAEGVEDNPAVPSPDVVKSDVEEEPSNPDRLDVANADTDSTLDGGDTSAPDDSETESETVDGSDTTANQQECAYDDGLIPCDLVGETQCVEGQPKKQEKCVAGDGCPYWSDQFCEAGKVCQDGACQCEAVCPDDGTCGKSDGCNGICECGDGQFCDEGVCGCVPNCPIGESTCGQPDGCGGTCPDICIPEPDSGIEVDGCITKLECLSLPGTKTCEEIPVQDGESCLIDGQDGVCAQGLCEPDVP